MQWCYLYFCTLNHFFEPILITSLGIFYYFSKFDGICNNLHVYIFYSLHKWRLQIKYEDAYIGLDWMPVSIMPTFLQFTAMNLYLWLFKYMMAFVAQASWNVVLQVRCYETLIQVLKKSLSILFTWSINFSVLHIFKKIMFWALIQNTWRKYISEFTTEL